MRQKSLAEIALHAKRLLVVDGWIQNVRRREVDGVVVGRCAASALEEAAGYSAYPEARALLGEVVFPNVVTRWNDAPERTKQDVLDAFDEMARLAKEREL
jgi:hypothetical protein